MHRRILRSLFLSILALAVAAPPVLGQPSERTGERRERRREDPQQRAKSLKGICKHLGVGEGAVIADIGAGSGRDTWTFAEVVGSGGKVYAEEIEEGKIEGIREEAKKRELSQVEPVLGGATDPEIPAGSVDMAYMNRVYHHFSKPREMLQGIWKALKPGGHLVIVDQRKGTLTDWVPREVRAEKHYWIAETTVVREAREQGYLFVEYADDLWHQDAPFVLVFQRPKALQSPDRDPDPPLPLPAEAAKAMLPAAGDTYARVAVIALGEGRKLVEPILDGTGADGIDIVLEEWATQKDERPELPQGVALPSVLTEKGDPKLGDEPLDAVYFLDTYHLLFHGPVLLEKLRERLTPDGRVYVLDRRAPKPIPHREASHRRMIAPQTVKQEMGEAGFTLLKELPAPAEDRFLLVFGKTR